MYLHTYHIPTAPMWNTPWLPTCHRLEAVIGQALHRGLDLRMTWTWRYTVPIHIVHLNIYNCVYIYIVYGIHNNIYIYISWYVLCIMVCCLMWCCVMLRFVMWCCVVWCDAMLECIALHNILYQSINILNIIQHWNLLTQEVSFAYSFTFMFSKAWHC